MSKEHWVVRNNTGGLLYLPKLGLSFRDSNHEKELCFLTGKTVAELEKDPEIILNIKNNNLSTISKEKTSENSEKLLEEINELKKIMKEEHESNLQMIPSPIVPPIPVQQIDIVALIDAIKNEIRSNIIKQSSENVVLLKDDDEKTREDVMRQLIFKSKDTSVKNFKELGSEIQIENEGEGNEDLLGDILD